MFRTMLCGIAICSFANVYAADRYSKSGYGSDEEIRPLRVCIPKKTSISDGKEKSPSGVTALKSPASSKASRTPSPEIGALAGLFVNQLHVKDADDRTLPVRIFCDEPVIKKSEKKIRKK